MPHAPVQRVGDAIDAFTDPGVTAILLPWAAAIDVLDGEKTTYTHRRTIRGGPRPGVWSAATPRPSRSSSAPPTSRMSTARSSSCSSRCGTVTPAGSIGPRAWPLRRHPLEQRRRHSRVDGAPVGGAAPRI
jgi:hypothetical protein